LKNTAFVPIAGNNLKKPWDHAVLPKERILNSLGPSLYGK
jgi:hypothetical protein